MKKVMLFGTFDIIHPGHLNLFRHAKRFGDNLVVVVARDENVKAFKGRKPKYDEKERARKLKLLKIIDKVFLGYKKNKFKVIERERPKVICLGYDQEIGKEELKEELKKRKLRAKIVRLGYYKKEIYKSSKLRDN